MPSDITSCAYWAKGAAWAPHHDDRLVRWWWKEVAVAKIADSLGRTPGSVYVRANKIGLPTRREGPLMKIVINVTVASMNILRSFQRVVLRSIDERARKPEPELKSGQATRKCLTCGGMFASEWIGNRMCDPCKSIGEGLI